MPGRISELDLLDPPAADDQIEVLDGSDTAMAITGTNKRSPISSLGISTATQAALDLKADAADLPPIVVQATEPDAADYGLATIPVGAVWIELP